MHRLLAIIVIAPTMLQGMMAAQQVDPRIQPVNASANVQVQNQDESNRGALGSSSSVARKMQGAQSEVLGNAIAGRADGADRARAKRYIPSSSIVQGAKLHAPFMVGTPTTSSIGPGSRSITDPNSKRAGGTQNLSDFKARGLADLGNPGDKLSGAAGPSIVNPILANRVANADRHAQRLSGSTFDDRSASSKANSLKRAVAGAKSAAAWQQSPYRRLGRKRLSAKIAPSVRQIKGDSQQKPGPGGKRKTVN